MTAGKQMSGEWCLLLTLLLAFPAAAQDVARAPGHATISEITPVPASTPDKEAARPGMTTPPEATPRPATLKRAAKSGRDDAPSDRLPASQLGMGCAEEKNQ